VVGHVKMDSVPSPYNYALMLPQSETERLLEESLQRLGVSVERSTEATALKVGADGAEATLRRGLSHCRGASAKRRRLRNFQAAATAVRHVSIATARSARCVWAEVR
jgi:hypothetical protein